MLNIGSGFSKTTQTGKTYISIALEGAIVALIPFLKNVTFTLWYVPKEERKSEKSPAWKLTMGEPYTKQEEKATSEAPVADDEEIPF